jgi:hypothetical protein
MDGNNVKNYIHTSYVPVSQSAANGGKFAYTHIYVCKCLINWIRLVLDSNDSSFSELMCVRSIPQLISIKTFSTHQDTGSRPLRQKRHIRWPPDVNNSFNFFGCFISPIQRSSEISKFDKSCFFEEEEHITSFATQNKLSSCLVFDKFSVASPSDVNERITQRREKKEKKKGKKKKIEDNIITIITSNKAIFSPNLSH